MFRSEPIVRDKCARACPRRDLTDKMAVSLGASEVEPSAVQVEEGLVHLRLCGMNPDTWNTADESRFEGDAIARHPALHQCIDRHARFDPPQLAFGRSHGGPHGGNRRRIVRVERAY